MLRFLPLYIQVTIFIFSVTFRRHLKVNENQQIQLYVYNET